MSSATRVLRLTIDGREVAGEEGKTVLQVAEDNDIHIPHLCYMEGLSILGSCRLCLVEIEGQRGLKPACATSISQGMVVTTTNEKIDHYRRMVIEMMFAEGNHICAVCVANGNCELQSLARELGMDHVRVPYQYDMWRDVDTSHHLFGKDHNRCILCMRCVRVCDEYEGVHTKDVFGRALDGRIIDDLGAPWGKSQTCTSCGKCVSVCPTGALFDKSASVSELNRDGRFLTFLQTTRREE